MQKKLNLKIKFGESFRPLSILIVDLNDWFDLNQATYVIGVKYIKKKTNKNDRS